MANWCDFSFGGDVRIPNDWYISSSGWNSSIALAMATIGRELNNAEWCAEVFIYCSESTRESRKTWNEVFGAHF